MYERFTDRARKVMQLANQEAQRLNHEYIGTSHVLLGLIKEESGLAGTVLRSLGGTLERARREYEGRLPRMKKRTLAGDLPRTPEAQRLLGYAMSEANDLKHGHIGPEHLLLGLLHTDATAVAVLRRMGLSVEEVRAAVLELLGHGEREDSEPGEPMSCRSAIEKAACLLAVQEHERG